jgi:hypothetical protein
MANELVLTPSLCHFTPVLPSSVIYAAADNFEATAL